jgi:hypothetical protein
MLRETKVGQISWALGSDKVPFSPSSSVAPTVPPRTLETNPTVEPNLSVRSAGSSEVQTASTC